MARLKAAAAPIPKSRANATLEVLKGKAILVAAFPASPIFCPMKIWSTIL